MSTTVSFPRRLLDLWREHRKTRVEAAECAAIAQAFNDRYTYRVRWKAGGQALPGSGMFGLTPLSGNAWMCPECNQVHMAESCSHWDGLHYPGCCSTPAGNRHNRDIRLE